MNLLRGIKTQLYARGPTAEVRVFFLSLSTQRPAVLKVTKSAPQIQDSFLLIEETKLFIL